MTPRGYPLATWRGTLPVHSATGEMAFFLDADGAPVRYRIPAESARKLAESILGYLPGVRRQTPYGEMAPEYYFDDYPREGCSFECERSRHGGYLLSIFSPQGHLICSHAPAVDLNTVLRMVQIWADGRIPYPNGTPAHENNFRRNPDCLQPPVAPQRPKTSSAETPPGPASECST